MDDHSKPTQSQWNLRPFLGILGKRGFPGGSAVKNLSAKQESKVQSLGREDPLEEGMATHSTSYLENLMDERAWRATVHRVTKSWTWLKQLNTHAFWEREAPSRFHKPLRTLFLDNVVWGCKVYNCFRHLFLTDREGSSTVRTIAASQNRKTKTKWVHVILFELLDQSSPQTR